MRVVSETAGTPHAEAQVSPHPLSPTERADLCFYAERGWLIALLPEEAEDWHRRRQLEAAMSNAIDSIAGNAAVGALNEALAAAQGEFPPIARDKQVTVQTRTGAAYTFSYAPLDTILACVRPALSKHRLALTQLLADNGAGPNLVTELRHADGALIRSTMKLPAHDGGPQALGSLLTYMRRYAIVAILGIAAEEDDDGNQAQGNAAKAAAPPTHGKAPAGPQMITAKQHARIGAQIKELTEKWPTDGLTTWPDRLREEFKIHSRKEFTEAQASKAIDWLQQHLAAVPELNDV